MKILMTIILSLSLTQFVHAQSSVDTQYTNGSRSQGKTDATNTKKKFKEAVVEKGHNVKRAVKKGAHKMQEMVCRKDDQKCNALKERHRAQEQAEYYRDKLSESEGRVQEIDTGVGTDTDTTP